MQTSKIIATSANRKKTCMYTIFNRRVRYSI